MHGKTASVFWNWARFPVRCTAPGCMPATCCRARSRGSLASALVLSKPPRSQPCPGMAARASRRGYRARHGIPAHHPAAP